MLSDGEGSGSETYALNIQDLEKIHLLFKSTYYKELWRETATHVKDSEFQDVPLIPLDQVCGQIYTPAFKEFENSYKALKDLSMSLQDLQTKLGRFLNSMSNELNAMADVFTESQREWIGITDQHIKRYTTLQSAKEKVEVISELKKNLCLGGDFGGMDNLEV